MKDNFFICFTGIDGSGKTTLAKYLTENLNRDKVKVTYVYNRYVPSIFLRFIMSIGKLFFFRRENFHKNYVSYSNAKKTASKNYPSLAKLYQSLLFLDYALQIFFKIKLKLIFKKNIICDRYIYDTIVTDLAVDFNYSNFEVESSLNRLSRFFPKPDFVFLIDLSEEIAFSRKDDVPSIEYLKDRRKTYLYLSKNYGMIKIDGTAPVDELKNEIYEIIKEII